jgi:histidinol-phosphate aminotransferase
MRTTIMLDPLRSGIDPLRWHGDQELAEGLLDAAVNVRLPAPPAWLAERLAGSLTRVLPGGPSRPGIGARTTRYCSPPEPRRPSS